MNLDWEEMSKEAERIEKEYQKKKIEIFNEIKKCPNCKELPTKVILCDEHWNKLDILSKDFLRKQTELRVKLEFYPEETKKAVMKALEELAKGRK